jgi:hypothetical protein
VATQSKLGICTNGGTGIGSFDRSDSGFDGSDLVTFHVFDPISVLFNSRLRTSENRREPKLVNGNRARSESGRTSIAPFLRRTIDARPIFPRVGLSWYSACYLKSSFDPVNASTHNPARNYRNKLSTSS